MIKCQKCGNVFPDNSRFCGVCGAQLYGPTPALYVQKVDEKEPFLAIIFSFILAGLGQIYCGKIARGLVIMVISFVPMLYVMTFALSGIMMDHEDFMSAMWSFAIVMLLYLVFWVWQIYDAYQLSVKWNDEAERTHTKPW
ncbi:MAG: zinc ribbon domain-containing protein [Euryarchaeota archaeon]|nr:zinc ribbon domain-containing protein [Euryarchaeota archaeon]